MEFANAINLDRKSGGAKWRDLLCAFPPNNSQHSTSTYAKVSHFDRSEPG